MAGGRRVLVTGLGTFWGGRVAQELEADPSVEVIVGLDREEPTVELERTEYVRSDENYSILSRIVKAVKVDTIVHTFLVMDSSEMRSRRIHEINVIGTMNLFAAASAAGSTVRTVAVKSSTHVYGAGPRDPNVFLEEHKRTAPARTAVEQTMVEVEGYVRDFAEDNPHVTVSLLRFANVVGSEIRTPLTKALSLPLVPTHLRVRPEVPVRPRGRRRAGHPLRRRRAAAGHLQRRRRRPPAVERGGGDLRQAHLPAPPVRLHRHHRGAAQPPRHRAHARARRAHEVRPRRRQPPPEGGRLPLPATRRRAPSRRSSNPPGSGACAGTGPAYHYERDVEQFFRHSPAVARDDR